jgi:hypothetical protein
VIRLLIGLVAAASVLSLAPAAPVPKGADRPVLYFPTKVGTTWVYDNSYSGETEEVLTAVREKDGATIVSVDRVGAHGELFPERRLAVSGRGLYLVQDGKRESEAPCPWIQLPHKPGDTWKHGDASYWACAVERVRVPAGVYLAVRVDCTGTIPLNDGTALKYTSSDWYAAEVGLVKRVAESFQPGLPRLPPLVIVLKSFTPGKD